MHQGRQLCGWVRGRHTNKHNTIKYSTWCADLFIGYEVVLDEFISLLADVAHSLYDEIDTK